MRNLSVFFVVCQFFSVSAFAQSDATGGKVALLDSLVQEAKTIDQIKVIFLRSGLAIDELTMYPILFPIPADSTLLWRISSEYGNRTHPIRNERLFHRGVDIAAPLGTHVYCSGAGKVSSAKYSRGYGWFVEVDH